MIKKKKSFYRNQEMNKSFIQIFWKSSFHLSSCILYTLTIILSSQLVFACSEIFGLFFFSNTPHSIQLSKF